MSEPPGAQFGLEATSPCCFPGQQSISWDLGKTLKRSDAPVPLSDGATRQQTPLWVTNRPSIIPGSPVSDG